MQTKQTTLPDPNGPALVVPAWASATTKQLAADARELFDTTKAARLEVSRLQEAAQQIDLMQTSVADLSGAAGMARQAQLEALRDELLARSKFAEFLDSLESDRRRVEREALAMIETARNDAKAALLSAGCPDLSGAVTSGGRPDETLRIAFNQVVNACPEVGRAADMHRGAKSLATSLVERGQFNRRAREEAEKELRGLLTSLATAAVG